MKLYNIIFMLLKIVICLVVYLVSLNEQQLGVFLDTKLWLHSHPLLGVILRVVHLVDLQFNVPLFYKNIKLNVMIYLLNLLNKMLCFKFCNRYQQ